MWNFRHDTTLSCLVFSVKTIEKITSLENPCSKSRSDIFTTSFISTIHNSWYRWLKNPKKSCLTQTPSFNFAETGCCAPIWPDVTSIFVGWFWYENLTSLLPPPPPPPPAGLDICFFVINWLHLSVARLNVSKALKHHAYAYSYTSMVRVHVEKNKLTKKVPGRMECSAPPWTKHTTVKSTIFTIVDYKDSRNSFERAATWKKFIYIVL